LVILIKFLSKKRASIKEVFIVNLPLFYLQSFKGQKKENNISPAPTNFQNGPASMITVNASIKKYFVFQQ